MSDDNNQQQQPTTLVTNKNEPCAVMVCVRARWCATCVGGGAGGVSHEEQQEEQKEAHVSIAIFVVAIHFWVTSISAN